MENCEDLAKQMWEALLPPYTSCGPHNCPVSLTAPLLPGFAPTILFWPSDWLPTPQVPTMIPNPVIPSWVARTLMDRTVAEGHLQAPGSLQVLALQ